MRRFFSLALLLTLVLTACGSDPGNELLKAYRDRNKTVSDLTLEFEACQTADEFEALVAKQEEKLDAFDELIKELEEKIFALPVEELESLASWEDLGIAFEELDGDAYIEILTGLWAERVEAEKRCFPSSED